VRCVRCEIDEFNPPSQIDPREYTRIAIVAPLGAQTVAQFTKQYKFSVSSSHVDSDAAAREAGTDFARTTGLNPDSTIA
jgi:hypothetical protein